MLFQVYISFIHWWDYFQVSHDNKSKKAKDIHSHALQSQKNKLEAFLSILKYVSKFSLVKAEVCKPLRGYTSVKTEWMWNGSYQKLFNKAKAIKQRRYMHEILRWNKTTVPRNRCIWVRMISQTSANETWNKMPTKQCPRQHHPKTTCFCQQEPGICWKNIEKEAFRNTTWVRKVPLLLLCKRGMYHRSMQ